MDVKDLPNLLHRVSIELREYPVMDMRDGHLVQVHLSPRLLCRMLEIAVVDERVSCAHLAKNACLNYPDGGSPTTEEGEVCEEAYRRIMKRSSPVAGDLEDFS